MQLSIVIPSYNSQDNLSKSLSAVNDQLTDIAVEVIVVDCSPGQAVDAICQQYDCVRLIKVEERFNPGEGRNIGAKAANGDYLVFIDSDVVIGDGGLKNIIQHAQTGYKVFGGALELDKARSQPGLASYIEHFYFNHESHASRSMMQRANLSSALMIIEKALFLSVDGFKDIPRMQDTELTERLISMGHTLYFFPDIVGYQIQDSPLSKVLKKIAITGNNVYFIRYGDSSLLKKIVFVLLLPLMMFAKISRINLRNLRYAFSFKMLFVLCPVMYFCGLFWMFGFYKALFLNQGIVSGR